MSEPSPWPWKLRHYRSGDAAILGCDDKLLAWMESGDADASMMVTAPELADALEKLGPAVYKAVMAYVAPVADPNSLDEFDSALSDRIKQAVELVSGAVLRKARGFAGSQ